MPLRSLVVVALLLLLSGCGGLPRPFEGQIGADGRRLIQPPPARLSVEPPTQAMLSDVGGDTLAGALAEALVTNDIPAVVDRPRKGDWSLVVSAELLNGKVVPSFDVHDPTGKPMGTSQGAPVDPRAWSDSTAKTMRDAAVEAAPKIATLLETIDAAQKRSDPNSLLNRPARIVISGVTGAPGDGNSSLVAQMKRQLPQLGEVVQDTDKNADFSVSGQVNIAPGAKGMQRVEIQWIVKDANGEERGRILQLNEVPPGTLDRNWGDVAMVVVQEAAGGVKDVIFNQAGGRRVARAAAAAKP